MGMKIIRNSYNITQAQVAKTLGIPLRTYIRYERDESYGDPLKRKQMLTLIKNAYEINEDKGILTIEQITKIVNDVIQSKYEGKVECCYLFGSYAKGYAKDNSDVDLCVCTTLSGFKFVGLLESLKAALNKRVDLIRIADLGHNIALVEEIMKDGIKIYG